VTLQDGLQRLQPEPVFAFVGERRVNLGKSPRRLLSADRACWLRLATCSTQAFNVLPRPMACAATFTVSCSRWLSVVVVTALACVAEAQTGALAQPDLAVVAARVVSLTNTLRARNELGKVDIEPQLSRAAQEYAEFMADNDRIAHDADGRTPAERVKAAGYDYCMVAENVEYVVNSLGFSTEQLAARLVQNWEKSPEHRRNLLLEPITEIGVGVAQSVRSRRYYAVQLLARPRIAALNFEVANRAGVSVEYEVSGERFELPVLVTRLHSRCAQATLRLLPAEAGTTPITVKSGAHYVVDRTESGQVRMRAE